MMVRPTRRDDIAALQAVVDASELFPGEMLPDMASGFLSDDESSDIWLTCVADGDAVGFCYAVPEKLTDGAWNMLAIAVLPARQGGGCGSEIVRRLEADLTERGQRILMADTSGSNASAPARAFYRRNGYVEEARIRDFWAVGDDKIVFWKSLA